MTRRISISAILFCILLLTAFASPAKADLCFNGYNFDANGNVTGTCTSSSSGTTPTVSSVPGNGGIFSCTAPGATSIGSTVAIGGTYVPVSDSAVELNTGVLAYEKCMLQPLFNQQKQAATVAYVNNDYNLLSSGRNGNPYWVVNYANELGKAGYQGVTNTVQSGTFAAINPAFQSQVETAVLRNYQSSTQAPQTALTCPYTGNMNAALNGTTNDVWGALDAFLNPACSPYSSYVLAQNQLNANVAAAQNSWQTQLDWSHGIYSVTDQNGNVVVPGIFLNAEGTQALTSGFRQLENANDIGQMVGSFFAGLGAKLLSGPTSVADVQSYLGQAVQQQQNSLASSVTSTALTNLNQILNWEEGYNSAQEQMASTLTGAITQLQSAESACWQLIIENVCDASSTPSGGSCTSKSGGTLHIATSTEFSNAAIAQAQAATIAQTLSQNISVSNSNLTTINSLIAGVQSSDSATSNTALEELNTIVNASPTVLHTQSDVTEAQNNLQSLESSLNDSSTGLVPTTIHTWAGDDSQGDVGVVAWNGDQTSDAGWCNINQAQTLANWTAAWSQ